jgi:hypothetical protein
MLRMALLGLLILLGVGVLSAMELRTPPRNVVAVVHPIADPNAGTSDTQAALAKGDRLDVAAVSSERPAQPAPIDEPIAPPRIAPPEDVGNAAPEPPGPIAHHRPNPKKVATAARPKSKPKAPVIKRTAVSEPSKAANETEPCRLKAFGGLRKALNSDACEI